MWYRSAVSECYQTFRLLLLLLAVLCICESGELGETESISASESVLNSTATISNFSSDPDVLVTESSQSSKSSTTSTPSSYSLDLDLSSTSLSDGWMFSTAISASSHPHLPHSSSSPGAISNSSLISSLNNANSTEAPSPSPSPSSVSNTDSSTFSEESIATYSEAPDIGSSTSLVDDDLNLLSPVEFHEQCPQQCFCYDLNVDCRMSGLTTVPPHLPSHLHHLDLHGNDIAVIDSGSLKRLTHLRTIILRRNRNISIDVHAFEQNSRLQRIDLSSCHLKTIPKFHLHSENSSINLAYNNIESLDWGVISERFYYGVRSLDLSHNRLRQILSSNASQTPHLHTLILSWNGISDIADDSFVALSGLRELSLAHNRLETLHTLSLRGMNSLQHLDLSGNRLSNISDSWLNNIPNLKSLNLSANEIGEIDSAGTWQHFTGLNRLDLSGNRLRTVTSQTLAGLNQLTTLILSRNQLSVVDADAFQHVPKLQILNLDHNHLSTLLSQNTATFAPLKHLLVLSLAGNSVTSLGQTTFAGMTSLRVLQLGVTELSRLPQATFIGNLEKLQEIHLSSTHFVCNCHLEWFADWWREKRLTADNWKSATAYAADIADVPDLICASPERLAGLSLLQLTSQQICERSSSNNNSPNYHNITDTNRTKYLAPEIVEHPVSSVMVAPGVNITLRCKVETTDTTSLHVNWYLGDHKLTPNPNQANASTNVSTPAVSNESGRPGVAAVTKMEKWASVVSNSSMDQFLILSLLHLYSVNTENAGSYWCSAANKHGAARSTPAKVQIHVPPSFTQRPVNTEVEAGKTVRFTCTASGHPTPVVMWSKLASDKVGEDGGFSRIPADRLKHVSINSSHLTIANVSGDDAGVYMCSVNNSAGLITAIAKLTVLTGPNFIKRMSDIYAASDSVATLNCAVIGSPEPDITWLKNNQPLFAEKRRRPTNGRSNSTGGRSNNTNGRSNVNGRRLSSNERIFVLANAYTLVIMNVSAEDSGRYTCRASNTVRSAEMSASLFVTKPAVGWSVLACGAVFALPMVAGILIFAAVCLLLVKRVRSKKHRGSARRNDHTDAMMAAGCAGRSSCLELHQRDSSCPDQLQQLLALTKPTESTTAAPITGSSVKAVVPCGVFGAVMMARDDGSEHSKDSGQSGHDTGDPTWLVATTGDCDSQQKVALVSSCTDSDGVYGSSTAPRVLTTFKSTANSASLGRPHSTTRGSLQNIVPRHLYADRRLSQLSQQRRSIID